MGWVTLASRKQSLYLSSNHLELRDLSLSRSTRSTQRDSAYEQSIIKNNKSAELREIKDAYDDVRSERPEDMKSEEYSEWMTDYNMAREDYESQKNEINDYYEDQLANLEQESADKEAEIQQEQQTVEAQLEAVSAEIEAVEEQMTQEIEQSTIQV